MVEAALVIALVGVALAVFIPTFVGQLRTSKLSEAPELLAELHQRAAAYYEARHEGGRRCLPGAAGPAPAEPRPEAAVHDFTDEGAPGAPVWGALEFRVERPIRYSYQMTPNREGCDVQVPAGGTLFRLEARGDLDGDGVLSSFVRKATTDENDRVVPVGSLYVERRVE